MLHIPSPSDFQKVLYGPAAARPAAAYGTTVTPGDNTKGSYAQLISGASLTEDVYLVEININANFVAATARSAILDIGYDPAGGTSYSILIADLMCASASNLCITREGFLGYNYMFPLFIKAGTSIGAAASVDNATVGTLRCWARFYCKPKHPEALKVGSYVESLGVTAASSEGTTVTSGTTSEGSWTSLGTTTKPAWWFQVGGGVNNLAITSVAYFLDLSAGASGGEKLLIDDVLLHGNSNNDLLCLQPHICLGGEVVSGASIWGRAQCSGTAQTMTMMAYCLGG